MSSSYETLDTVASVVTLIGIVSVTLRISISNIRWNRRDEPPPASGSGSGSGSSSDATVLPGPGEVSLSDIPVSALETIMKDGSSEIQVRAKALLKGLYIQPEGRKIAGLLQHHISDPSVKRRDEALMIMQGLIIDEAGAGRVEFCNEDFCQKFVEGLFESIESTARASPEEVMYRRSALKFVTELADLGEIVRTGAPVGVGYVGPNPSYLPPSPNAQPHRFALLRHGLADFFVQYDRVAKVDPHLPSLDELTDPTGEHYQACYWHVLAFIALEFEILHCDVFPYHKWRGRVWQDLHQLITISNTDYPDHE